MKKVKKMSEKAADPTSDEEVSVMTQPAKKKKPLKHWLEEVDPCVKKEDEAEVDGDETSLELAWENNLKNV